MALTATVETSAETSVVLAHVVAAGFEVLEVVATDDASLLVPPQALAQFTLLFEGAIARSDRSSALVEAGGLLFTPPGELRQATVVRGPVHAVVIRPDPGRLRSFRPLFPQPCRLTSLRMADFDGELWQRVVRNLHQETMARNVSLEGTILTLIAAGSDLILRCASGEPAWLRAAVAFIDRNLDQPIGLPEIAAAARISRSTLAEGFHRDKEMTVGQFLRRRRLRHACRLLRETQNTLCDIAHASGFCDQSHMARVFREDLATTPLAYRRGGTAAVETDVTAPR